MIKDLNILVGGAAGQGIQTIGSLLTKVCHAAGLFIFSTDDFESRIRGGHSFHLLRISDQPLSAPRLSPDIIVAIDTNTLEQHKERLTENGLVLLNAPGKTVVPDRVVLVDFDGIAKEAGGKIASNTVAAGAVLAVVGAPLDCLLDVVRSEFKARGEKVLALNLEAAQKGFEAAGKMVFQNDFDFMAKSNRSVTLSGAKAAALGALSADCRFFPFYPMSPGTGIVTQATALSGELPVVIEQAEDEIAAVNMAVGASFAGIRSLVSTSGGGFCLMTEGLGLAGMSETPLVIVDAQRPGPATGLATRTAQADLLFAINASHDEFPRFVFAPGSVKEVYDTVKRAFYLTEKFQVPAIILMDQFLTDSAATITGGLEIGTEHETFIEKETKVTRTNPYLRYRFTDTGISPRQVPGAGSALVRATGNEHTPEGVSTESERIRVDMVNKRFKKLAGMKDSMRLPSVFCNDSAFYLTGWGSSKGSIMEACLTLREQGINAGWIIFEDLWPLDETGLSNLLENKRMINVEANATSQLGSLIRQLTGRSPADSILKYDGRPIYPQFIIDEVKKRTGN